MDARLFSRSGHDIWRLIEGAMFRLVALAVTLAVAAPAAISEEIATAPAKPTSAVTRPASPSEELNTLLMHATFRVFGKAKADPQKLSFGTVFVMGIPRKNEPNVANIVLITAAHVLEDILGDTAIINLRKPTADGSYVEFAYSLPIRAQGKPLYVKHSVADVAAMYADLPDEVPITGLAPDALVTDETLRNLEFHPGDEAFTLGFPQFAATPGAFPIIRTGRIASYPLTPMRSVKQVYFDLLLYGGNSGGPVYYSFLNRKMKQQLHFGLWQGVLGLVSQKSESRLPEFAGASLNLGIVVPAVFIQETIDLLPPWTEPPTGSVLKPQ